MPSWIPYPVPLLGSVGVIVAALIIFFVGRAWIQAHTRNVHERYGRRKFLGTLLVIAGALVIIILWSRVLQHTGTFLGLIGAGLAIALREPLLSVAGRVAIFAGHMYTVGDRVQFKEMSGDVIDVGPFYTRMLEIGNWIKGDQATGRIVQIPNAQIFGTAVYNYTQNFGYIWDEVQLPITYGSNIDRATRILKEVGGSYTKEFLQGAQAQLEEMKRYFLVPDVELGPMVYVKVTSNWVQLNMRYIVEPKQRRAASSFIYAEVFHRLKSSKDIQIASETMDLTVHPPEAA